MNISLYCNITSLWYKYCHIINPSLIFLVLKYQSASSISLCLNNSKFSVKVKVSVVKYSWTGFTLRRVHHVRFVKSSSPSVHLSTVVFSFLRPCLSIPLFIHPFFSPRVVTPLRSSQEAGSPLLLCSCSRLLSLLHLYPLSFVSLFLSFFLSSLLVLTSSSSSIPVTGP